MSTNTSAEFLPIGFGIQMRTKKISFTGQQVHHWTCTAHKLK